MEDTEVGVTQIETIGSYQVVLASIDGVALPIAPTGSSSRAMPLGAIGQLPRLVQPALGNSTRPVLDQSVDYALAW